MGKETSSLVVKIGIGVLIALVCIDIATVRQKNYNISKAASIEQSQHAAEASELKTQVAALKEELASSDAKLKREVEEIEKKMAAKVKSGNDWAKYHEEAMAKMKADYERQLDEALEAERKKLTSSYQRQVDQIQSEAARHVDSIKRKNTTAAKTRKPKKVRCHRCKGDGVVEVKVTCETCGGGGKIQSQRTV